jgi:thymidine kinase
MFLEPIFRGQRTGWIEVICGSMFSGKTEELIRRLRRANFANQQVLVFKPATDNRYHEHKVVSHDDQVFEAMAVATAKEILALKGDALVIGIDEAQFFDLELVEVCQQLAVDGHRVIIAGLDMDYRGVPFGPMPSLLAVAEYVTKVHAICVHCGSLATHSYRKVAEQQQVMLGSQDSYEPRCRTCYHRGLMLSLR